MKRAAVPVLAVLLVAAAGLAGWQSQRAGDAEDRVAQLSAAAADREAVADVAGRFGVALLSYDHTELNAARQRVLELATDRFGREYTDAFVNGLDAAITELRAVAEASLVDVYVGEVTTESAQAVVTLDAEITSTEGTRRIVSSYLDLRLLREDGQWRVDVATSLAALDEETTPAPTPDPP